MNCNESNWIAFSDVGVFTHANEMSFSLIHARVYQHFVAVVALEIAGGNHLLSASEEFLGCSCPWIHSGAAFMDVYKNVSHAQWQGEEKRQENSLLIKNELQNFFPRDQEDVR